MKQLGITILEFLGVVALFAAMFFGAIYLMKNEQKSLEKRRVPLDQERQAAVEEAQKLDPEEHKTVLTDRVLKADYRLFYETRKSSGNAFTKVVIIFAMGVLVFCFGSVGLTILRARRKGEAVSILRIISYIVPAIFMCIVAFIFTRFASSMGRLPKPDEAGYTVYSVNILRKNTEVEVSTDSDGDTRETTLYYIYYEGTDSKEVKMEVSSKLYDDVTGPGPYYMAMAKKGEEKAYFAIYTFNEYKKAE